MKCRGCGNGIPPYVPSKSCAQQAHVVAAREFSDQAYFVVHRITVPAYALQHPDASSEHALAVHLVALRGAVAEGLDVEANRRRIRWASDRLRAHPPGRIIRSLDRGTSMTIADVVLATSAEEHCATVMRWAGVVWAAWELTATYQLDL